MNDDKAHVIPVIETRLERRGAGKDFNDPIRIVTQYWSLGGELLAEVDPHRGPDLADYEDAVARLVYDLIQYDGPAETEKPAWVPGGNSNKQEDARRMARIALRGVHSR